MQKRLPSVQVREFVEGGHSIHNTATEKFMEALLAVVDDAAKAAAERPWPAAARSSLIRSGGGVPEPLSLPRLAPARSPFIGREIIEPMRPASSLRKTLVSCQALGL